MIYVDDMRLHAVVGSIDARWSHLWSDTSTLELEQFAHELGLNPKWIQNSRGFIHYDVVDRKRNEAIRLGAKPVSYGDLPDLIKASYMQRE